MAVLVTSGLSNFMLGRLFIAKILANTKHISKYFSIYGNCIHSINGVKFELMRQENKYLIHFLSKRCRYILNNLE